MRWILILVMISSFGCSWAITSEGAFANFGQATLSTCGATEPIDPTHQDCTVIQGAPISEQAGNVVGGFLATVLRMLGMSYGVPAPPAQ